MTLWESPCVGARRVLLEYKNMAVVLVSIVVYMLLYQLIATTYPPFSLLS